MGYKIKKSLILEKKGQKITIFDPDRSTLLELNETASFIFKKITKGVTEEKILNLLMKHYKIEKNIAKKDLTKTINKFKKKNIIENK